MAQANPETDYEAAPTAFSITQYRLVQTIAWTDNSYTRGKGCNDTSQEGSLLVCPTKLPSQVSSL